MTPIDLLALYGAVQLLGWLLDRIKLLREPQRFQRTGGARGPTAAARRRMGMQERGARR